MKNIINSFCITMFLLVFGFMFTINASALTIKESVRSDDELDSIADGTIVIGITKFDGNQIITAGVAMLAGTNYSAFYSKFETPKIYVYQSEKWFEIDNKNNVAIVEETEMLDVQDIYYINNKEKMIELDFLNQLEKDYEFVVETNNIKNNKITIKDNKIIIPATTKKLDVFAVKDENKTKLSTFEIDNDNAEYTSNYVLGTIQGADSSSYTINNNNVTVLGENIKWFPHAGDIQNGRTAGNYVAVKITAPKEYNKEFLLANTTVSLNGKEFQPWDKIIYGAEDVYFTLWQKVVIDNNGYTVDINWAPGNTQTFNIALDAETTLEAAPHGVISSKNKEYIVEGNDIIINGSLAFHLADPSAQNGRKTGFYGTGIIFTAPEHYNLEALLNKATVKFNDGEAKAWKDIIFGNENVSFTYWPRFNADTKIHTVTIEWEPGNIQVYKIKLSEDIIFEEVAGTYQVLKPDNSLVENNTANITGEIKWYEADAAVGRNKAGNRVGVKITAPEKINTSETTVKIDDKTYNWNDIKDGDGKYFEWWPLITNAENKTLTAVVIWAEGVSQTFTINLNDITLEANPKIGEHTVKVGEKSLPSIEAKNNGIIKVDNKIVDENNVIIDEEVTSKLNTLLVGNSNYVNLDYDLTFDNDESQISKAIVYRNNIVFNTFNTVENNTIELSVAIAEKRLDTTWILVNDKVEWKIEWYGEDNKIAGRTFFATETLLAETEV